MLRDAIAMECLTVLFVELFQCVVPSRAPLRSPPGHDWTVYDTLGSYILYRPSNAGTDECTGGFRSPDDFQASDVFVGHSLLHSST